MLHWQDSFSDSDNGDSNELPQPTPEEIIKTVLPDIANKEGCYTTFPSGVDNVLAIITCDNGEEYTVHDDETVTIGINDDVTPVPEDNSDIADDTDEEQDLDDVEDFCSEEENFIVNGSFEEGHGLGNNKWGLFDALPGWYAMLDRRNAAIEIQNGNSIGGIAASDGQAKLELDAHNKNGYTMSDAIVAQDIFLSREGIYKLSFDYSPRVNGKKATNKVTVKWNGEKIAKLLGKKRGWRRIEVDVITKAGPGVQRLIFKGKKDSDTLGGYIDNVRLTPVCDSGTDDL